MLFFCLCFGNCIHHFPDHLWLDLIIPLYHSSYFEKTLCPKDEEINARVFWTDGITENGVVGYEHRNITAGLRQVLQIYLLIQPPQLQMCLQVSCFVCLFVFDSLRPTNNLSVIKGRAFLGKTSTKLVLMFLLMDTTQ